MTETQQDAAQAPKISLIPVGLIDENPENARTHSWDVDELAASVRDHGVLSPCHVIRTDEGRFQIIAGHRRYRAAKQAGLTALPCICVRIPPSEVWALMLTENIQRRDLNPIEEARAFQKLRAEGMTIVVIAWKLKTTEARISKRLALLELPESVQEKVLNKELTLNEAWVMARDLRTEKKGPAPGSGGRTTKWNDHFNQSHPLWKDAMGRCDRAQHPPPKRLGPACGKCWEEEIRNDEHANIEADGMA